MLNGWSVQSEMEERLFRGSVDDRGQGGRLESTECGTAPEPDSDGGSAAVHMATGADRRPHAHPCRALGKHVDPVANGTNLARFILDLALIDLRPVPYPVDGCVGVLTD